MSATLLIASGLVGLGCGAGLAISVGKQSLREARDAAKLEAQGLRKSAAMEAGAIRRKAETQARESALALQEAADAELESAQASLDKVQERVSSRGEALADRRESLDERKEELRERESAVRSLRDRAKGLRLSTEEAKVELLKQVEVLSQTSGADVIEILRSRWLEEAHADGAQLLRTVEQSAADAETSRTANRLITVAVSRYQNHFLIDQSLSNIPVPAPVLKVLMADDERILSALAKGANTKLNVQEGGESIRLEGLDGVGREVARRGLKGLARKAKALATAQEDPEAWVQMIRERLDGEVVRLGKKAFKVLKVKPAHSEIVSLVGALNYRTSYTQNQWLHAVEASFLAGMMAQELGLDVRLARRATLLHDIGKALTHKIEGSHAVIGADIARRLGEDEIVANAIGSHHADEPANSAYAYLVAAADAMSGGRPGARREQSEGFSTRLEDLERLGSGYKGVDHCAAVHGGRELRVYVRNNEVSDLQAVEMSTDIAERISEELVFPGQVKVTVIRATESVAVAL
ncbi:MAG: DUF3552 domain-containing protein [Myxococcales bacterium]|nr:DUF3552 domain-containing protein [Myxococcales bacterium]